MEFWESCMNKTQDKKQWAHIHLFLCPHLLLQYICCDCKKSFCSLCSVLQENLRTCATCHLLKATAFQRPRLMRLRVRDLRQYLLLHSIPTDTCREKEDLVDLVLCHQGMEEEEEPDTGSLHSRSLYTPTPSTTQSTSELSAFVASQEEPLSRSDSSDTNQVSVGFILGDVTANQHSCHAIGSGIDNVKYSSS